MKWAKTIQYLVKILDFFSIFLLEFMVSINSSFDLAKSSDAPKKEVGHDTKKI